MKKKNLKPHNTRMRSYLCFVFTASALKCLLLHVCNGNESTEVTHIDLVGVRGSVQSLMKKLGSTMSYLTITLHLTKTQTSITITEKQKGDHRILLKSMV